MKKNLLRKKALFFIVITALSVQVFSQTNYTGWLVHYNSSKDRVFVENKGQFKSAEGDQTTIKYAFDDGQSKIYFTDKGLIYSFTKQIVAPKSGEKEEAAMNEEEEEKNNVTVKSDLVDAFWEGANSDVQLIADLPTTDYYSYGIRENNQSIKNINHVTAFKKIIYKNLYPNIDVEYIFHPDEGIEYSLILHPGADITQVKMHYSDGHQVRLVNGDVHISTSFGDIIDHAPTTFYSENHSNIVSSGFLQTGNTISFGLENYDNTKEVTIDPWTIVPAFPNSKKVWNTQVDGSGNVYLYGGDTPLALKKYSALGVLQWTYNTPWDSATYWMGTMITDLAGNSYVTSGSNGEISKVSTAGGLVWHNNPNGLFGPLYEYWHLAFNCDQTQLVVGGMTAPSVFNINKYRGAIMNINLTNGAILSTVTVGGFSGLGTIHEVRSICSSSNGNFYFMTLDSIGSVTPALALNYKNINNYNFAYGSPTYAVNGNLGLNAMKTNGNFIYTQNGKTVDKRDISTGAIVATATIPGGTSSSFLGSNSPGNSGLDIDSCGNVYVGSINQVVQYDANLNQLATAATPSAVYDVAVNKNGEVIACGNGFATSLAMANCHPIKPICLICVPPTVTVTETPATICAGSSSTLTASGATTYSWSTGATTASITGSPGSTATFTVTGTTGGCTGSATVTVVVNLPPDVGVNSPTICSGESAILTASGALTYSWSTGATTNPITVNPVTTTSYTVTGTDANGCTKSVIATVTVNPPPTIGVNSPTICSGTSAVLTGTGGTSYSWSTGATTTSITVNPVTTTSYTVTGTDANGCTNSAVATVTVAPTLTVTATASPTSICLGSSTTITGGGALTYSWSDGETTNPISVNPATTTTYTVTGTSGGCTGTATVTVTVNPLPTITVNSPTICNGTSATLTGAGGTSYSWNTGATTNTISVSPVITTTYTVTGTSAGCTGSATVTVTVNLPPTIGVNSPTICSGTSAVLTGTGGTSYSWSTGATTNPITVNPATTTSYTVTGTDANGCTNSAVATVTVGPGLAVTAISSPTNICVGSSASLTASGAATYSWSDGETTNPISVNPATTTTYTVTGTSGGCTGSATVSVTVNPPPTIGVNSPTICSGTSATLTGSGGTSYSWSDGETTTSITVNPVTTTSYTVTGTDANGCTNSTVATVTVNPIPTVTVSSSASSAICAGDPATLTANGASTYSWSDGETTNLISVNPVTTTTYTVTGTSAGCTASATVSVTVNPRPLIDSTNALFPPVCKGALGSITGITTSGGTVPYTYSWTPSGQTTANATGLTAGSYTLTVTDANGCTATSGPYIITTSLVTAAFNANPDSGTAPLNVNFTNTSTGANNYEWYLGNGDTTNAINPSTNYPNTGSYNVELIATNSDGCSDTAYGKIDVFGESILIVPNVFSPNGDGKNDVFTVKAEAISTFNAEIFDRWGIKLYEWENVNGGWDGRTTGGVEVPAGTYYYLIKATGFDGKQYIEKGYLTLVR